jgi:hypothetical protein
LRRALISNAGQIFVQTPIMHGTPPTVGARLPANRLPPQRCIPWLQTYIR